MLRLLRIIAKTFFVLIILLLALLIVVPPFLDRLYYQGPPSDHFDGAHFFNPEGGELPDNGPRRYFTPTRLIRFFLTDGRPVWPDQVPVHPTVPPVRVAGGTMRVTWIGHSTVLIQTRCLNILTDPIWSDYASPLPPLGPKRHRAPGVRFDDLPPIDLVLISHSHYDHLDIPTLRRLWSRDHPLIVTSLGNDAIMAAKGIESQARDWGGRVPVRPIVPGCDPGSRVAPEVIIERVHHWGTRFGRDRNRALWSGFTVMLPGGNLFFAGDTGFGDGRWPGEAARHGPVRLALIPIGSYKPAYMMAPNHIDPVQAVAVFERLGAAYGLGLHWGTFQLSAEPIDEPPLLLARTLRARGIAPDRFRATEVGQPWMVPMPASVRK